MKTIRTILEGTASNGNCSSGCNSWIRQNNRSALLNLISVALSFKIFRIMVVLDNIILHASFLWEASYVETGAIAFKVLTLSHLTFHDSMF